MTTRGIPTAHELTQAHEEHKYDYLWQQAIPLVKRAISKLNQQGISRDQYDDLFQEGSLAAGAAVRTWVPAQGAFSTWIMFHANVAMKHQLAVVRNGMVGNRRRHAAVSLDGTDQIPSHYKNQETLLDEESIAEAVRSAVGKLPAIEAMVVRARWGLDENGERQSAPAVAQNMGMPLRSIERIAARAVKKLAGSFPGWTYLSATKQSRHSDDHHDQDSSQRAVCGAGSSPPHRLEDDVQ